MSSGEDPCFGEDIRSRIILMKGILSEILDSLGISVHNPRDVYKKLNIDKKLGWKIYNVIAETDPFLAAQYVPGKAACRSFLQLARKLGTPKSVLKRARTVCGEFDSLVARHAGGRHDFDLMLMACSKKGRHKAYLSQQKAAFNAYSHILGVQAGTQFCSWVFAPSADGNFHDVASIRGFLDFRRNRPHVPWLLEWAYFTDDDDTPKSFVKVKPLEEPEEDGSHDSPQVPFYGKYCSKPMPSVISSRESKGRVVHELEEAPIGNTETITVVTGQIAREVFSSFRTKEDRYREILVRARTPVERLVFDQVVHEDLLGPEDPELFIFGEFTGHDWACSAEFRSPNSQLPIEADIQKLGKGPAAAVTPYIPWYTEMLSDVFEKLDWDPDRFVTYRTVIEYPVVPSTISMRSLLPERKRD